MRLWLKNPGWQLYVMPRQETAGEETWSWGLYGPSTEAPLLEQASFALEYRKGRTRYQHRPSVRRLVHQESQGPERGQARWMGDAQGLYPFLEMELHPSLPLVRWRFRWHHEGEGAVQVQQVVLFEVGPLKPFPSSRHRWGLGFIPAGFLRMRRPRLGQVGALRLHPSPGALRVIGPPWPWQETLAEYSLERPYLPPRQARLPQTSRHPPRPDARNHAFSPAWAWVWDADHHRGLAIGVTRTASSQAVVEVRMEALHPAVRVWYTPDRMRWEPGHVEATPWTALAFFDLQDPAPLDAFWNALGMEAHAEVLEARRWLDRRRAH